MKLYGYPGSTCTRKVLMTLHEKGLKADFVNVDLAKREQKSPEHLERQPFGVVPVLDDDGYQLYESRAIIRYLDAKFPAPSLTPSTLHAYGRMEQWMSIEQSYFSQPVLTLVRELVWKRGAGGTPDMGKVDDAREKLIHVFKVTERHLLGNAWMAGETFSLADICFAPYFEYLGATQVGASLIQKHPLVAAWWQRVSSRPSWKAASGKAKG